jgi:hypothetical protein
MTKRKVLKLLKKELENWQDSLLDKNTAKAILKVMEEADMLNPFHTQKPGYNKK